MLISIIHDVHTPKIQYTDFQGTFRKSRELRAFTPTLEQRGTVLCLERMRRLLHKREEGACIIYIPILLGQRWGEK